MRETAEADNDVAVPYGIVEPARVIVQTGHQGTTTLLIGKRFAVLERQVEKTAFDLRQPGVVAALKGAPRHLPRLRVAGEGARVVAIDVAWHLVEQQDQGQASAAAIGPGLEATGNGGVVRRAMGDFHQLVEGGVLDEPAFVHAGPEPERENRIYGGFAGAKGIYGYWGRSLPHGTSASLSRRRHLCRAPCRALIWVVGGSTGKREQSMVEDKNSSSVREITASNRVAWDEAAPYHRANAQYAAHLAGFARPGHSCLDETLTGRLLALGLEDKDVVQVCCNNGREILSIKNLGAARCLGIDQSAAFLAQADELAAAGGIDCEFLCRDIYDLPDDLRGAFDLAVITIGVLCWMPDLEAFFAVAAGLLRRGGQLAIYEDHPILNMATEDPTQDPARLFLSYFREEPWVEETGLDYYGNTTYKAAPSLCFFHKFSDIFMAARSASLELREFEEFAHNIGTWPHLENQNAQLPLSYFLRLGNAA